MAKNVGRRDVTQWWQVTNLYHLWQRWWAENGWWAGSRAEEKQGSKAGVRDFSTERSYEDEVMKFQTQFKVTTVIYTLPGVLCFAAYFILSL